MKHIENNVLALLTYRNEYGKLTYRMFLFYLIGINNLYSVILKFWESPSIICNLSLSSLFPISSLHICTYVQFYYIFSHFQINLLFLYKALSFTTESNIFRESYLNWIYVLGNIKYLKPNVKIGKAGSPHKMVTGERSVFLEHCILHTLTCHFSSRLKATRYSRNRTMQQKCLRHNSFPVNVPCWGLLKYVHRGHYHAPLPSAGDYILQISWFPHTENNSQILSYWNSPYFMAPVLELSNSFDS